ATPMVPPLDPLPYEPKTLREFVEADLRRAARLIIKVQDEIDPQFRFSTPEGRLPSGRASADRRAPGDLMGDPDERLTFGRALRAPEFRLLVVASLAAAGGVPWWVALPLTLAGLSIASLPKYVALWPRARHAGAEREWLITVALSMCNNLATS